MKKMIYFLFALLLLSATSMNAQVAIGTKNPDLEPRPGAILDLSQVKDLGLLLPKVTLTAADVWEPVAGEKVDGMMVFNDSPCAVDGLDGKGVYIWVNGRWDPMGASFTVSPPAQPGTINAASTNPCKGDTGLTYSVTEVDYADSYTWTVPEGWTITSVQGTESITVNVTSSAEDGYISVTADNCSGPSDAQTIAVTVNDVPGKPGDINGPKIVTVGTGSLIYEVDEVKYATSYTWTVPATGWTITAGATTNSITVSAAANAVDGNITVKANGVCEPVSGPVNSIMVSVCPGAVVGNVCWAKSDASSSKITSLSAANDLCANNMTNGRLPTLAEHCAYENARGVDGLKTDSYWAAGGNFYHYRDNCWGGFYGTTGTLYVRCVR